MTALILLSLIFVATTAVAIMRSYRPRRTETQIEPTAGLSDPLSSDMGASLWRCRALITEALIVGQRLSGEIDAETYQYRMKDVAEQAVPDRRPRHNA
jgi:hypothetical protein